MAIAALLGLSAAVFVATPLPAGLLEYRPMASVKILDRDGGLLRELLSRADGRSTPLHSEQIPSHIRAAFIAAEDRGFFSHHGIAPLSMGRALIQNLKAGRIVAGGSTLTQQLARNLVPRRRSLIGKLQEALWALRLEAHLSKDEILTQLLNRVPFGNNTFGVEAASQLYFGRGAKYVSIAQAAVLASIPRGPTAYNPYRSPERLKRRMIWVLGRMGGLGLVDPREAEHAVSEPLDLQAFSSAFRAPHFVDFIAAHLDAWGLGSATRIETTLDPKAQAEVEDQISQELSRLADRRVSSAAVVVVDNLSGEVLAYQGSADFFDADIGGENDGVQMHRQPGSALKPFVYAEAFSEGFTPASVIADLDTHLAGNHGSYAPKNYDRRTHGPVRLREALANSYNVPAVRLADSLGTSRVYSTLQRAGFRSLSLGAEHYGLGLVLGNGEVSLWEAARAYSGLSRGGVLEPLHPIQRAFDAGGHSLPIPPEIESHRFANETSVALVTSILSDSAARARAFGLDNALRLSFPVAAKTGTSKGYSDNWTVGYTRERTVAVWAGNFDGAPMIQVSGITGAGPIFKRVMTRAMNGLPGGPLFSRQRVETARICPLSGELAGPDCPSAMDEVFAPGTRPKQVCSMHHHLSDQLSPELAARCRQLADVHGGVRDLGLDYYDWARDEGLAAEPWLAAQCAQHESSGGEPQILFPAADDEFMLIHDLPQADQSIPLRIRASPRERSLNVRMDGRELFSLVPPFVGRIPANQGEHLLTLYRPGDQSVLSQVHFRVRTERALGGR